MFLKAFAMMVFDPIVGHNVPAEHFFEFRPLVRAVQPRCNQEQDFASPNALPFEGLNDRGK